MTKDTLLSARGLHLSFGAIPALDGVDADLWPGEVLAIVGESGSGKTTLLNALSGALAPDRALSGTGTRMADRTTSTGCPRPCCAPSIGPTGASCGRIPGKRFEWLFPRAAMWANG